MRHPGFFMSATPTRATVASVNTPPLGDRRDSEDVGFGLSAGGGEPGWLYDVQDSHARTAQGSSPASGLVNECQSLLILSTWVDLNLTKAIAPSLINLKVGRF
jgi:hypothetical protein